MLIRFGLAAARGALIFSSLLFVFPSFAVFAQSYDLEINLDVNSNTVALPNIFKPSIDLSGRGRHFDNSWPQSLAAGQVLDIWQRDIGLGGLYRIQYNLWEINERAQKDSLQENLLTNYESIIKRVTGAGGIVILDIFGTPAGLGKVLDKKSPSLDIAAFKELVKKHIRELSCIKKYNIWYEVWSAPDLDDFFLGRKQEYLAMYRAVAESVTELENETKIHIPIGGPSVSWWFQNCGSNTIVSPENSLIYELIKYCYSYHLPLDFITWHTYSTDPTVEYEITGYNKTSIALIRDWLTYFKFDKNTLLVIDEWNYDSGANFLPARQENANICASFIPARIKNMYESGVDYQLYFCLEDFQNNSEHVSRNTGIFWFDSSAQEYKGGPKSVYNVFRMMSNLGRDMLVLPKVNDEFIDIIATKQEDTIFIMIYNYIDPDMGKNYLSRNIALLNDSDRKTLLNFIKSDKLEKIISGQTDVYKLRITNKLKSMFKKAQELNTKGTVFKTLERNVRINIKNLKDNYTYERYIVNSSCSADCEFVPSETKDINASDSCTLPITVSPFSVNAIILKKKTKEAEVPAAAPESENETNKEKAPLPSNQTQTGVLGNGGNIFQKPKEPESTPVTLNQSRIESEVKNDTAGN